MLAIIAKNLGNTMEGVLTGHGQHLLVTALLTLGSLAARLGTLATSLLTDSALRQLDTVFTHLLHPKHAVRLAADQCLGLVCSAVQCLCQVCMTVPIVLTPWLLLTRIIVQVLAAIKAHKDCAVLKQ